VAMTITLISFGMLFASLFLGYFLVRFNSPAWPPVEIENLPKLLPFLSTVAMLFSSLTYYKLEKEEAHRKFFWILTAFLGVLFLGLQWLLWSKLNDLGIVVQNGIVPSMVYAFTWLHAAHIVVALVGVFWIGHFIWRTPEKVTGTKLMNVGKFWHFLGVVWFLMYLMFFVL
jgi:cytochrome c oxidase subunit 3